MISVLPALSALKMMGAVDSSRTLVPICSLIDHIAADEIHSKMGW